MRKMLNTLYITSEDAFASLRDDNVEVLFSDGSKKRIPLINIENIVIFSYKGATPALLGACEARGIPVVFYTPNGRYLATVGAATKGNVLLRREQHRISDDENRSLQISRNFIVGKIYNSKHILMRCLRDHPLQVNVETLNSVIKKLSTRIGQIENSCNIDNVRGIEGIAASEYFSVFDELILQRKDVFTFVSRSRRPPTDPVNAMLSFGYSILSNECVAALVGVGLDPYVGIMHSDKPGRKSLALDLMEELRSVMVDRFVISMINNRVVSGKDFIYQESGGVEMMEDARKTFVSKWQERKREEIIHPYLNEKLPWGLIPHSQAMLLSRCIREELDQYPPFFWR